MSEENNVEEEERVTIQPDTAVDAVEEKPAEGAETEATEEVSEEKAQEVKEKAKRRLSDRNRDLTRKWREEERKNKELEERLAKLEESSKLKEEPDVDNYDTIEDYKKANAQWMEQERAKIREEEKSRIKTEQERTREERERKEAEDAFVAKSNEYTKSDPKYQNYIDDVQDIINAYDVPDVEALIVEAKETGPEVITYFGKNPDKLEEIASLPPAKRIFKMGQLVSKLEAKPVKKSSSAPNPVRSEAGSARKPVSRGGSKHVARQGETFAERARRLNGR